MCGRGTSKSNTRAQSTLEFSLALMVLVVLLAGAVKVLCWGVGALVGRHNAYVGKPGSPFSATFDNPNPNFYTPPKVSLVPQMQNVAPPPRNIPITGALLDKLNGVGLLTGNRDGAFYRNLIRNRNITVRYAALQGNVLGQFDPGNNTIYIDENLRTSAPESVILSIILHEATHADYMYNADYWRDYTAQDYAREHPGDPLPDIHISGDPNNPADSIDQEYNAFKNEVEAYETLRDQGGGMDPYLESLSSLMAQGEADAKVEITKWYGDEDSGGLPPY